MSSGGSLLIIDTATTRCVVALADADGTIGLTAAWDAGYRHGETLLPAIERLLVAAAMDRRTLGGIVVGTGPGAFTGLRVGIATAKGLAHGLGRPLVGASTAEALLAAARATTDDTRDPASDPVLLLPAGPSDRLVVRPGVAGVLLVGGHDPELAPGEWLVAVDLADRAPTEAVLRGEAARAGLAEALARSGVAAMAGPAHGLTEVVPDYVTLPRGVKAETGEVAWSRDPR